MSDPFDLNDVPLAAPDPQQAPAEPAREPDWLARLNPEQRRAVEVTDGPVLVLAGAGTGKTRVLTTRLAYLLATNRAWPGQILSVTFTNKAAREMRERVGGLIGGQVEGLPFLGTFHSIGARILRRHAELVGRESNFTILDTDDQIRLLKQLIEADDIDDKRWPARMLAGLIDGWKNRGLGPDKVPSADAHLYANGKGITLYRAYQHRLQQLNAVDFGDLLLLNLELFQSQPDVLADYQRRFKYILVDEYQDTNVAQYLWLRLLAQGHKNICCVGDEDQSIYAWRGAEVGNILRFEQDFDGATIVRLERNYRSTEHILGAASGLIATNESRLGKTLWTEDNPGEPIIVQGIWDGEEEARLIGEEIETLQRAGHSLNEMAILVRAGFQTRAFEERFLTLGLNYRVVGGAKFYERLEIRDALAYLRTVHQPSDDLAFERIINKPKRGIGDKSIQIVHTHARNHQMPMVDAARELVDTDELRGKARTELKKLLDDFDRWRTEARVIPHTELAEMVLDESGYTAMWQADKTAEAPGRLDNLKELVNAMDEFDTLGGFLEHIALVMENDKSEDGEKVSLMTLHAAKGLEFDCVFLPGWEEGLFPSQRTLDESGTKGLEEERRLAYVGITRARKRAMITFVANRFIHGQWMSSIPSRFVDEIPEQHVEIRARDGGLYGGGGLMAPQFAGADQQGFSSTYETPGWKRAQSRGGFERTRTPNEARTLTVSATENSARYKVGERVFHDKFGYGQVALVEGNKLTVQFDKAGRKKVIDRFVERVK